MTMSGPKRRSPWMAALLPLLQPGLGQLYRGRVMLIYWAKD